MKVDLSRNAKVINGEHEDEEVQTKTKTLGKRKFYKIFTTTKTERTKSNTVREALFS